MCSQSLFIKRNALHLLAGYYSSITHWISQAAATESTKPRQEVGPNHLHTLII